MEREVENTIERLSMQHGRVHVSGGFSEGLVRATVPNGAEHHICANGDFDILSASWYSMPMSATKSNREAT